MIYPTERKVLWGLEVSVCPEPCSSETGCLLQHLDREHWWGQHNGSCIPCKEVTAWRRSAGISNVMEASGLGPDHKGDIMSFPILTTEADIATVVDSLRKLEADLA